MEKRKKPIQDAAVDPVSFKLPYYLDLMVRDKSLIPHRSEFLRRAVAISFIAITEKLVCGTDIAELVMSETIEPSDIILLIKAESLSMEYVKGLITGSLITGKYAREIKQGIQALENPERLDQAKVSKVHRVQRANNHRRSL